MSNAKRAFFVIAAVAAVVAFSRPAMAQLSLDGGSGLFNVQKASTLGHLKWGIGAFYSQDNHDEHLSTDQKTWTFPVALGVGERFEIGASLPVTRIEPKGMPAQDGVADGWAQLKWNFYKGDNGLNLGIIGGSTLATGDKDKGLGTEKSNPAAMLAISKEYDMISWHGNVGYMWHNEENVDDQVIYGAGLEVAPIEKLKDLSVIAEVSGFSWSKQVKGRDDQNLVMGGLRYYISHYGSVSVGYGSWGGGAGVSSPNSMWLAGVTVGNFAQKKAPEVAKPEVPAVVPPKAEQKAAPQQYMLVLESVHFQFDKSDLTPMAQEILKRNAQKLMANPGAELVIEGNTCSIGSRGYNFKLGLRRAMSAKNFLQRMGINMDRMEIISYGEDRPAYTNKTREGRRLNRRDDFVIKVK